MIRAFRERVPFIVILGFLKRELLVDYKVPERRHKNANISSLWDLLVFVWKFLPIAGPAGTKDSGFISPQIVFEERPFASRHSAVLIGALVAKWFASGFYFLIRLLQQPGFLKISFWQVQFAEGNLAESENFSPKFHPGFSRMGGLFYLPSGAKSQSIVFVKGQLRHLIIWRLIPILLMLIFSGIRNNTPESGI